MEPHAGPSAPSGPLIQGTGSGTQIVQGEVGRQSGFPRCKFAPITATSGPRVVSLDVSRPVARATVVADDTDDAGLICATAPFTAITRFEKGHMRG